MNPQCRRRMRRWVKRLLVGAAILLVLIPLAGALYQSVATWLDARRFPPPGRLIDVDGRRLHLLCTGRGSPAVVLEAGLLSFSLQWAWVQPEVARFTTVCSYDRAGYGWSDRAPWSPTAGRQARDLNRLLTGAGVPAPYVLVGSSYGGFVVRAFSKEYPESVAGMVLVDSAHPSQMDVEHCDPACIPKAVQADEARMIRIARLLAHLGIIRVGGSAGFDEFSLAKRFPMQWQPAIRATLSATRHWEAGVAELEHFAQSADDARALKSLDGKPLVVVAADSTWANQNDGYNLPRGVDPVALDKALLALMEDQTKLSEDSKLVVVPGATHVTLATSQKDAAAVVEAVREVVEKARNR